MNRFNIEGLYNESVNLQKYLPDALIININNKLIIGSSTNNENDIKEFLLPSNVLEKSTLLKDEYNLSLLNTSYVPKFIVNLYIFETYILSYLYDNQYKLKESDFQLENEVNELFLYFGINKITSTVINQYYNPKRSTVYIYTLFYNVLTNKIKQIQGPSALLKFMTDDTNILFNWNNINIEYYDNTTSLGLTNSSFDKTILHTNIKNNLYIRNILFSILKNSNDLTFNIEKYEYPLIKDGETYLFEDWYIQGNINKLNMI